MRFGSLISAMLVAATAAICPGKAAAENAAVRVGSYAPPLTLPDTGGVTRTVEWSDSGPVATLIYFFDPQSSACLQQMSFLDTLYARARDFGLAIYAVEARGRQPAEVSRMMERYRAVYRDPQFPVLSDPDYRGNRLYGVQSVPTTILTEVHGVVLRRFEGYDHDVAVELTRRIEPLLLRERGFFSKTLREAGITEQEEKQAAMRFAVEVQNREADPSRAKPLDPGERAPAFDYTDLAGRSGRWDWPSTPENIRVLFFWGSRSIPSIEGMVWLDGISQRGREAGLEILAVEAGRGDGKAIQNLLAKEPRLRPVPSFPIAVDTGFAIGRLFGVGEQLPQTFLIGPNGIVIYRADRFEKEEAAILAGKIERAFALTGRSLQLVDNPQPGADRPSGLDEAPSVRRKRQEEAEFFRSNIVQGAAAFSNWEFRRALPYYLSALEFQPEDRQSLERTAQIYQRLGDPAKELEYWKRLLRVDPEHTEARSRIEKLQR